MEIGWYGQLCAIAACAARPNARAQRSTERDLLSMGILHPSSGAGRSRTPTADHDPQGVLSQRERPQLPVPRPRAVRSRLLGDADRLHDLP
jgi:hypothetical protein